MRQMKFKVWDKETKQFVNIENIIFTNNEIDIIKISIPNRDYHPFTWERTLDQVELIEFTGLKDKNGVEIYEGDILKGITFNVFDSNKESNYQVMWGVDSWHIKGTYFSLQELFNYCDISLEIIGNIYENQ